MIDPLVWAMTPGLGRAPNVAPPQAPAQVVQNPKADLVRLLYGQEDNRTRPGDMPRAFAPDPSTLSNQMLEGFHRGYGGWSGPTSLGRAPGTVIGGGAGVAGGLTGLGAPMAYLGNKGAQDYHGKLQAERTQRMAEAMERGMATGGRGDQARGQQEIAQRAEPMIDAYERGRQAAVGYRNEGGGQSRDQGDISRSQRGSRDTQHSIAI